ncbi:MAG: MotA/TolQ/ExbB proton channel family protein [Desulfobacterales bacterium]
MFSVFTNGGPFMFVILGVSIIAMAVFLERAAFLYFRMNLNMDKALKKVLVPLEKQNFRGAIEECSRMQNHPLGGILKAGLLKADRKDQEIERAMEEKIVGEIPKVKARINLLTLFANIATLLGLLGTILGLITAFQSVGSADETMKQEILARGISMAMLTTAGGLIVAIPCLGGYYLLNNRGEYLVDKIEEKALGLANALSAMKQKRLADGASR